MLRVNDGFLNTNNRLLYNASNFYKELDKRNKETINNLSIIFPNFREKTYIKLEYVQTGESQLLSP